MARKQEKHTIAFNHEWLDNVVTDHLEVGVSNPVTDGGFGTGEKIVEDGDLMAEKHQPVDKMRADESSPAGDKYPFAL